jgi:hypothetical protein
MDLFKNACRIHLDLLVNRYLLANTAGRASGAEKALTHRAICDFYIAAFNGVEVEQVGRYYGQQHKALHLHTQSLTDNLDEKIGFPYSGHPDHEELVPKFFEQIHALAMEYFETISSLTGEREDAS